MMNSKVSYAQNGEDIVLARALHDIKFGFYVDIGAWNPDVDSVSKLFYQSGWCGINIDPVPEVIAEFQDERPRDMNIQVALSDKEGLRAFTIFPGTGWHTFYPELVGEQPSMDKKEIIVPTNTLDSIMEKLAVNEIHWLKIDAEGSELEILRGFSFGRNCPWIIVIESTLPNSAVRTENQWAQILLKNGYIFCLFDGLNEFWLSPEHQDRAHLLTYPAGVHDSYVKFEEFQRSKKLESTLQELSELKSSLKDTNDSNFSLKRALGFLRKTN
jgi:FkbM family methyltransferase